MRVRERVRVRVGLGLGLTLSRSRATAPTQDALAYMRQYHADPDFLLFAAQAAAGWAAGRRLESRPLTPRAQKSYAAKSRLSRADPTFHLDGRGLTLT